MEIDIPLLLLQSNLHRVRVFYVVDAVGCCFMIACSGWMIAEG